MISCDLIAMFIMAIREECGQGAHFCSRSSMKNGCESFERRCSLIVKQAVGPGVAKCIT